MRTRTWFGAILGAAAVCLLVASPMAMADKGSQAAKLEGAWVAKVPGSTLQWNYVVTPAPSGRRASAIGMIDVGINLGESLAVDTTSPLLVEIVMTGPDMADFNSIWYGIRNISDPDVTAEIVYIGTNIGQMKLIEPGKSEVFGTLRIYSPAADGDHDGFPDEDAEPLLAIPAYTIDTRVPVPR